MWPASARGRTPGLETYIDEKKNIHTFSKCKLETIKIEGEVTNSMKLLFEEKNEPKEWLVKGMRKGREDKADTWVGWKLFSQPL